MKKAATTLVALAAIGTAAATAYNYMKPQAKQQLKRDMRNTAKDLAGVKEEVMSVGEDVTQMAKNLHRQM